MSRMVKLPGEHGDTPVDPDEVAAVKPYAPRKCDLLMKSGQYIPVGLSAEDVHAALFPEPDAPTLDVLPCMHCGGSAEIKLSSDKLRFRHLTYAECQGCSRVGPFSGSAAEAIDVWNWMQSRTKP